MKTNFFLALIVLLAVLLRFYHLDRFPTGFYSDEAAYAYNAYSIAQTGKDEYGNSFPIAFKSFGDYKAPLYIYFLVPFITLFGMGEAVIRSASAFLGILSVLLVYILVKELQFGKRIALLSAYMLSILPFALQFQRMAHENTMVVVLILSGLIFFLRGQRQRWAYSAAAVFFGLSVYTYHDARVLTPLLLGFLLIYFWREVWRARTAVLFASILFILLLVPLLTFIRSNAFWSRPSRTIFLADPGIVLSLNEQYGQDDSVHYPYPRLFHNKVVGFGLEYVKHYSAHFSPEFLFWGGDPVKIYQTIDVGLILVVMAPFFLLGFCYLLSMHHNRKGIVLALLILAPIPAALTRFVPSASRMLTLAPVLAFLVAIGVSGSLRKYGTNTRIVWSFCLSVLFILNIAYYLHAYYMHTPLVYAKEWHYGMREVLQEVEKRQSQYDRIWFSKETWGYIYPLYYLRYPPVKYQPQATLSDVNEYGFGWVSRFDKYTFADFPPEEETVPSRTLFIGTPENFPSTVKPDFVISYPDGSPAFYGKGT